MTNIVVDASVTLSWCFPDEQSRLSLGVLDQLRTGARALVPSFWPLAVLNTLLVGERRGRISAGQTKVFFDSLRILNPVLDHVSLEHVAGPLQNICSDHRLTSYDALYIELAMRSGCPLATLDQPQRQAARSLGVECL